MRRSCDRIFGERNFPTSQEQEKRAKIKQDGNEQIKYPRDRNQLSLNSDHDKINPNPENVGRQKVPKYFPK